MPCVFCREARQSEVKQQHGEQLDSPAAHVPPPATHQVPGLAAAAHTICVGYLL